MLSEYIRDNWGSTLRVNKEDNDTLIGLPYPYTVPCAGDTFQELYYWDTYFTNKGLLLSGQREQAKNNIDNIIYLVNKYGFMPNGNRTYYLSSSQPPFLSIMVRDIYETYHSKEWLKTAYQALEREYSFWMSKRITPIGLNQYMGDLCIEHKKRKADYYRYRVGLSETEYPDDEQMWHNCSISGESGWDMTPRWGFDAKDYIQPDLNSLLYALECNMEYFSRTLENGKENMWIERHNNRKQLMKQYLRNADKVYMDYNYKKDSFSSVFSAASYYPMFTGMMNKAEAETAVKNLQRLETDFGISATEPFDLSGKYQWAYPNGWAPLHLIIIEGLRKYNYEEQALRLARKYCNMIENIYDETGNLWEKYNVVSGSIDVLNEYSMPPMMGWTAGVYIFCRSIIDEK